MHYENITPEQFKEILAYQCRLKGAYEVTKVLSSVVKDASNNMKDNAGAIIHVDKFIISDAVSSMMCSHPLRMLADG